MGKINVLDKHVAELIAAGEVVERPSSVIKELVENSIDAGSTAITIEIKNGGISYMRITDNGYGIEKDDVKNAFLRNATSKIKIENDLDNISTLGFRGEALFSICAVSKVELMTRTKDQEVGTHYKIHGGEELLFEDCGCSVGTTIIVRDLFYNTPARMKFLKKNNSEGGAIAKILDRIALSHPEIAFKFIKEGKLELNTPGDKKVESAIYSVYGKDFFSSLIKLDYKLNKISLNGFISKPILARASRNMQHFFINGRYVKSKTAMVALEEAFKGSIMTQKFPACVMYIQLPFDAVDVNVHPSKVEVRFADERPIFDAVYHGVKTALIKGDGPVFSGNHMNFSTEKNINNTANSTPKKNDNTDVEIKNLINNTNLSEKKEAYLKQNTIEKITLNIDDDETPEIYIPKKSENVYAQKTNSVTKVDYNVLPAKKNMDLKKNNAMLKNNADLPHEEKNKIDKTEQSRLNFDSFEVNIRGEIFKTYIIVEKNNEEIVLIDKHAAHERLIYEKLKSNNKDMPISQIFLEPIIISLSKDEYVAVIDNIDLFASAGFDLDDFGNGTVAVRAAPLYLDNVHINDIVTQMANYILEHRKNVHSDYVEWLYENIACRAAVKAGKESKPEEMKELVKQIIKEDPRFCPHGRPIAITVKKRDIEKKFGRV